MKGVPVMQHSKSGGARALDAMRNNWKAIAFFVVAAGAVVTLAASTATAAALITSSDIKNQTISQADVGKAGVSGTKGTGNSEVERQSIGGGNIAAGSVSSNEIKNASIVENDLSPAVRGQLDEAGLPGYEVDGFYKNLPADGKFHKIYAECEEGKHAIGGGFSTEFTRNADTTVVVGSHPSTKPEHFEVIANDPEGSVRTTAWVVVAKNTSEQDYNIRPWVVCAYVR